LLVFIFTLTLSGCFTKNTQEESDLSSEDQPQVQEADALEIIQEPIDANSNEDNVEVIEEPQADTNSPEQEETIPETSTTAESETTQETSVDGSLEVEVEELESYEEDLEDLFKDILWEFDDSSVSE